MLAQYNLLMETKRTFSGLWMAFAVALCAIAAMDTASAQTPTTLTFTLDEPCKTSAGVFTTNGTLIRTLWNKVRYNTAKVYTYVWNGLDDNSNVVAPGTYE